MNKIMLLIAGFFVAGCSSIPGKMNQLYPGESKAETIKLLGSPDSVSRNGDQEAIYYNCIVSFGVKQWYQVSFERDALSSYGPVPGGQTVQTIQPVQIPMQQPYQVPVRTPVSCTSQTIGGITSTNCR